MLGIGIGISPMINRSSVSYNAITTAWIAQVIANGGSVTGAEATAISTYTDAIQIGEFDRLWVHGLQNEIAAKTSIVNPTSTMITNVNSTTFTAGEGFTGNGTTMYLNTNYNEAVNGVKFTSSDNCYGFYAQGTASADGYVISSDSNPNFALSNRYSTFINYNSNNSNFIGVNIGTYAGRFCSRRTNSSDFQSFHNGVQVGTLSLASNALVSSNFNLLTIRTLGLYSTETISMSWIGSGSVNQATFDTANQTLATTLGFNV